MEGKRWLDDDQRGVEEMPPRADGRRRVEGERGRHKFLGPHRLRHKPGVGRRGGAEDGLRRPTLRRSAKE